MFCKNCGKEVADNTVICPQCGSKIAAGDNKKSMIIIVGVCCAVVVSAILAVAVVAKNSGGSFGNNDLQPGEIVVNSTTSKGESTTKKDEDTTTKTTTATTAKSEKDSKGIVNPDNNMSTQLYYVQPEEGLFLREGPGQQYNKITLLDEGTAIIGSGKKSGISNWMYVRVQNNSYYGWVCTDYISTSKTTNTTKASVSGDYYSCSSYKAVVNDREGLNIRDLPDKYVGDIIDTIPYNREVTVLGNARYNSAWFYVKVQLDGKTLYGFVLSDYLDF